MIDTLAVYGWAVRPTFGAARRGMNELRTLVNTEKEIMNTVRSRQKR